MEAIAPYGDAIRFNRALEKARAIAANPDANILHIDGNVYQVRSQSLSDVKYQATRSMCSCLAWQSAPHTYDGTRTCKHTLAIRLFEGETIQPMPEQVTQPPPAPTPNLDALRAIAAGIESLNQRTSNLEDKLDQITDLLASGLAQLATPIEHEQPQAQPSQQPQPSQRYQLTYEPHAAPVEPAPTQALYQAPSRQVVQATAICKGFDSRTNKPILTVLAGQWQKFGVPVYPEVINRLGFAGVDALPLGPTPWDKDIIVEMHPDGRPKKVVGLAGQLVPFNN